MDNIRLISILQPGAQGVQQPHATQGATPQGGGVNVALPSGSILAGFIVNRDAQGNPVLRTQSGDVTFASQFYLRIGSEVVIRIEGRPGHSAAHILSVDGEPPEVALARSSVNQTSDVVVSRGGAGGTQTGAPAARPAPVDIVPGSQPSVRVTATVLAPPTASPGAAPAAALPVGTQLTLTLVATAPPAAFPAQTPAAPGATAPLPEASSYAAYARTLPPASPGTAPSAPAATASPTPSAASPLPSSTPGNIPPLPVTTPASPAAAAPGAPAAVLPPSLAALAQEVLHPVPSATPQAPAAAPPTPAIPQAGQAIVATVLAREPTGETLAQTPLGVVRLEPGLALPKGTRLTFQVAAAPSAALAPGGPGQPPASLPEMAQRWESLAQLYALLSGKPAQPGLPSSGLELLAGAPALPLAGTAPQAAMPPAQAISTGLLLFLAALRGNDFGNWLGADNVRWLNEKGHGELVRKAQGEFTQMARQFTEAPPAQPHWQALFFPLAAAGDWQQVRFFLRRDRKSKEEGRTKGDEDTRFVIEADLSQLGPLQLDGFVRRKEQTLEFDLFIRSVFGLSEAQQDDIRAIYRHFGEVSGYAGELLFQTVREFPVHPMEEILSRGLNNLTAWWDPLESTCRHASLSIL